MSLLKKLEDNKGTVSSALGKKLAQKVLAGDDDILKEAIELLTYHPDKTEAKNVRAGAAKIVEKVAEKDQQLVSPYLDKIIDALKMPEPQTRWMAIRAIGFCASDNPAQAYLAMGYAKKSLENSEGVCLTGATSLYLGELGAASPQYAKESLQILENFIKTASVNEVDWILEAFIKIYDNIISLDQKKIKSITKKHIKVPKKSTRKRVKVILDK